MTRDEAKAIQRLTEEAGKLKMLLTMLTVAAKKAAKHMQELADVAVEALPYVEMAEHDEAYKPGVVARMADKLREACTNRFTAEIRELREALAQIDAYPKK